MQFALRWMAVVALVACGRVERTGDEADSDSDTDADGDTDTGADADVDTDADTDDQCSAADCLEGDVCYPDGACSEFGLLCDGGEIRLSCGDGVCECSENDQDQGLTCPGDCGPDWSECQGGVDTENTCEGRCALLGMRCHDVCEGPGGEIAGARTYSDESCAFDEQYGACTDPIPDFAGAMCCCARRG